MEPIPEGQSKDLMFSIKIHVKLDKEDINY